MKQSVLAIFTLVAFSAAVPAEVDRRAPVCGSKGYDTNTEGYFYGSQGTYGSCSAKCQKDANHCKSFSFGNGECNLYSVAVAGNFAQASDSLYMFYDASCISSASPSTISTTTTPIPSSTTSIKSTTTMTISTSLTTTVSTKTTSTTKSTSSSSVPAVSSTTSKSSTQATTSTSTSLGSVSTPPCPFPTFVVTNFKYVNSTHNCDCSASKPDIGDGTGCLDGTTGDWCDPNLDPSCDHCGVPVCMTGLPTQPIGYGPADSVVADISSIGSCGQSNPGSNTPRREISGGNVVSCGGSRTQFVFDGDSNKAKSMAYLQMQNTVYCPDGKSSYMAYGKGQTAMSCSYDGGKNATCVLDNPSFGVPATQFDTVVYF